VNNYGYESKRRREKIYFRVYRSISFFTGFVECQEQGLQQQNEKKEQYEHLLRNFRKELKQIEDSEKKSGTRADDVVEPTLWYFEEMKFLIGQEEACTSLNTIQIGEEGEQESEEVDNGGDTSAISVIKPFISYSYCIMQIYVAMKSGLHY
jgi:hypothetical protein